MSFGFLQQYIFKLVGIFILSFFKEVATTFAKIYFRSPNLSTEDLTYSHKSFFY